MNDQLADSQMKQFFIDLLRVIGVENLWLLSRLILVVAGALDYVVLAIVTFAETFWLPAVLRSISSNLYFPAMVIAFALLILTAFLWSGGIRVRWVRPGAFARWGLLLWLLISIGGQLYGGLEVYRQKLPPLILSVAGVPTFTGQTVTVFADGTVYAPLDRTDPEKAAQARVMAPLADHSGDGAFDARDVAVAVWHATPAEVYNGSKDFSFNTAAGPLAIEGLPAGYKQTFFSATDESVPWYAGDFTTDPNGAVKRRQALKLAQVGTFQSLVGLVASVAELLRSGINLLFALSTLVLFVVFAAVAPAGLFGDNSLWAGAVFKGWLTLYTASVVVTSISLALTRLLFGTTDLPGIGTMYPVPFLAVTLYAWLHWRLFRASWGMVARTMTPIGVGIGLLPGGARRSRPAASEIAERESDMGFSDIGLSAAGAAGIRGYSYTQHPIDVGAPPSLSGAAGTGLMAHGLSRLLSDDVEAAQRTQRSDARRYATTIEGHLWPPSTPQPLTASASNPVQLLENAPTTADGAIAGSSLYQLGKQRGQAVEAISERHGAQPVIKAVAAAQAAYDGLQRQGESYADLAMRTANGEIPDAVKAAMIAASPELGTHPDAEDDLVILAQTALAPEVPVAAERVAASIGAAVAVKGDLSTVEEVSGVDPRQLGHQATYVGQYLAWAEAHQVAPETAARMVHEVMTTGAVASATTSELAPEVRLEGEALARSFPAARRWSQPLETTAVSDQRAQAGWSTGRQPLVGAGAAAAVAAAAALLDAPDGSVVEPVGEPDITPVTPDSGTTPGPPAEVDLQGQPTTAGERSLQQDGSVFEQVGETTITRINPDGSTAPVSGNGSVPRPAAPPPPSEGSSLLDGLKPGETVIRAPGGPATVDPSALESDHTPEWMLAGGALAAAAAGSAALHHHQKDRSEPVGAAAPAEQGRAPEQQRHDLWASFSVDGPSGVVAPEDGSDGHPGAALAVPPAAPSPAGGAGPADGHDDWTGVVSRMAEQINEPVDERMEQADLWVDHAHEALDQAAADLEAQLDRGLDSSTETLDSTLARADLGVDRTDTVLDAISGVEPRHTSPRDVSRPPQALTPRSRQELSRDYEPRVTPQQERAERRRRERKHSKPNTEDTR